MAGISSIEARRETRSLREEQRPAWNRSSMLTSVGGSACAVTGLVRDYTLVSNY